ncbi:hypothetical protein LSUE1_G001366 [Lachnellula suecica]|uniref:DUF1996 domain-containing protein n=1 Tax=Lachnellula suecica TaxID=602035 RepID=A0A8T9CA61_9HELO|nr:hypothetical protein LSUE1_G001366 [Lachnellula suecica]
MKWFTLVAVLAESSQAALRFGCSVLSVQRLDPLVQPGAIPSTHVHQIIGGNAFNATIRTDDVSKGASCTTCVFSEDFSNYWTALLYFKARNGTYKRVPQYVNADLTSGIQAGMTVYYTQQDFSSNGNKHITAFQPGFRMTVGSPTVTSSTKAASQKGLRYTCLQTIMTRGAETAAFPTAPCPAGIMAIHHFPACWDGKNLDSPNHQDHMYDTSTGGFQVASACPSTHPVRMPQLAYETMWNTTAFNDKSIWPTDGSQPFVWSYNDKLGYGTHGDYVFGWKDDALQRAMNSSCMFTGCGTDQGGPLKVQAAAAMNACKVPDTVTEDIGTNAWLSVLPGQKAD